MADLYDESVKPLNRRLAVGLGGAGLLALAALWAAPTLFFPAESPQVVTADLGPSTPKAAESKGDERMTATPKQPDAAQTLTTTTDQTASVRVEHPAGWLVSSSTGAVVLRSDDCGSATVLFYPIVLQDRELQAEALLTAYLDALGKALAARSGSLTLGSIRHASETEASILFTGTACGSPIQGQASALLAGSRGLVKLAWTPATLAEDLQTTITAMLQRYRTVESGTFLVVGGSRLEIAAPANWTRIEQAQSIAVLGEGSLVRTTVLPKAADVTFDVLFDTWIQLERDAGTALSDLVTVDSSLLADVPDSSDRAWQLGSRTITFTAGGVTSRAILTAGQTAELGDAALLVWRQAPADRWTAEASLLLAVEQSVQLLPNSGLIAGEAGPFTLPRMIWDESPSPLLGLDYAGALRATRGTRWTELILDYERVRSPSEATTYLAPTTAVQLGTGTYTHPSSTGTQETLETVVD